VNITQRSIKFLNDLRKAKINENMLNLIIGKKIQMPDNDDKKSQVFVFKKDMV
jgi:hypothetical protein